MVTTMKRNQPLVSIILVNWNGKKFLKPCIDSILIQTYKNYEVIFVDNASSDDSVEFLEKEYKQEIKSCLIRIIINPSNYGFAKANNIGINYALKNPLVKYIATLNADTIAKKNWLENLLEGAKNKNNVGMIQGKILRIDNKIDSTGLIFYKSSTWIDRGENEIDNNQYDNKRDIFGVCAAAALYNRDMLEYLEPKGEFFDKDFFGYCEDMDLSIRARLFGWCGIYVPDAIVYHHRGGTTGPESEFVTYHFQRNSLWLIIKTLPLGFIVKNLPFLLLSQLGMLIIAMKQKRLTLAVKAKIDAFRRLERIIRKRSIIMKTAKKFELEPIEKQIFPPSLMKKHIRL